MSSPTIIFFPPPRTSLHFTSLHFTSLHFTSLHFTSLHFTSLHFTSLHFTSLHFTSLHFTSLHFTSLHFTSLHFTSLHFTSLHFTKPSPFFDTPLTHPPYQTKTNKQKTTPHYYALEITHFFFSLSLFPLLFPNSILSNFPLLRFSLLLLKGDLKHERLRFIL